MELKKLVTLTFDPNVGAKDRVFRLLSGAAVGLGPWWADLPCAATVALSMLGAMWFATGVLSKCSVYYLLGYSTCPASGARLRGDLGGAP